VTDEIERLRRERDEARAEAAALLGYLRLREGMDPSVPQCPVCERLNPQTEGHEEWCVVSAGTRAFLARVRLLERVAEAARRVVRGERPVAWITGYTDRGTSVSVVSPVDALRAALAALDVQSQKQEAARHD
jgi:hypothetical protein